MLKIWKKKNYKFKGNSHLLFAFYFTRISSYLLHLPEITIVNIGQLICFNLLNLISVFKKTYLAAFLTKISYKNFKPPPPKKNKAEKLDFSLFVNLHFKCHSTPQTSPIWPFSLFIYFFSSSFCFILLVFIVVSL